MSAKEEIKVNKKKQNRNDEKKFILKEGKLPAVDAIEEDSEEYQHLHRDWFLKQQSIEKISGKPLDSVVDLGVQLSQQIEISVRRSFGFQVYDHVKSF